MYSYLKVGYDSALNFQRRQSADQTWQVEHRPASQATSFRLAAASAASRLRLPSPAVLLSGGVDSEVCARAFIDAGVPTTALIFQFTTDPTQDVLAAIETAERLHLRFTLARLELTADALRRAALLAGCPSPQLATHCLMLLAALNLGYSPILATGDNEVQRLNGQLMLFEREKEFSSHRYLAALGINTAVPAFFQATPELALARFIGPGTEVWSELAHSYEDAKFAFYKMHYPELRPREKLHGFEELGWQWDQANRQALRQELPANSETELLFELQHYCDFMVGLSARLVPRRRVAWSA